MARYNPKIRGFVKASVITPASLLAWKAVQREFALVKPPTLRMIGQPNETIIGKNLVAPEVVATVEKYVRAKSRWPRSTNAGTSRHLAKPVKFHHTPLEFLGEKLSFAIS